MGILCIIEVSKKQHYIFRTNRLKENIGASIIIESLTNSKVKEKETILGKCLKGAEVVNEGGGSGIYYFNSKEDYENFAKLFSFKVIDEYPSVELFMVNKEFDKAKDDMICVVDNLFKMLAEKKNIRQNYCSIVDFGIVKKCEDTRLPAIKISKDQKSAKPISGEISAKLKIASEKKLDNVKTENLGLSKGDKSYIAIVHIDGNQMGKKVKKIKEKLEELGKRDYCSYKKAYSKFSHSVKECFENAYDKMYAALEKNKDSFVKQGMNNVDDFKPVRKLILAGDDVCFICDARIALEAARIFLNEVANYDDCIVDFCSEKFKFNFKACAGVAMVKEKYPFFRAYELSEVLCRKAKNAINDKDRSMIYWHILQGEYDNDFSYIEDQYSYAETNESFTSRPYDIDKDYNKLKEGIISLNSYIKNKTLSRGKIKTLMQEIRKGKDYAIEYMDLNELYKVDEYFNGEIDKELKKDLSNRKDRLKNIFDRIELLDYYFSADEKEG